MSMRILYGIQATGNGHLARARALVPELRKAGMEIDFVFSGRPRQQLFNMEVFGPDYRCLRGLTFVTEKGRLNPGKTLTRNRPAEFLRDVQAMNLDAYDLVLTDFEPVTAWAARKQNKTSIAISHQSAFVHDVPKVPGNYAARTLMSSFAPATHQIGLHWHHFNQPVLPPLIESMTPTAAIPGKILVYMGFEALDEILHLLQPFACHRFVVYSQVAAPLQRGHIRVEPLSYEGFHRDLRDCSGVISNAGFELASECIMLGKKLLVKPLHGQYEQLCNARALELLQRGTVMHSMDRHQLQKWLQQPLPEAVPYPNIAGSLARWLKQGDYQDTSQLLQMWQGTDERLQPAA